MLPPSIVRENQREREKERESPWWQNIANITYYNHYDIDDNNNDNPLTFTQIYKYLLRQVSGCFHIYGISHFTTHQELNQIKVIVITIKKLYLNKITIIK